MAEQFEFQDLSDAVFWGVDLQRATFRDVDLMGARISHARLADVVIDAAAWGRAIERARSLPESQRHASVDGEWSFVETIRHLIFATDKWFTVPILGGAFHPIGLPNSGAADFGCPGIDDFANPTFEDAAAAWLDRWGQLGDHLENIEPATLDVDVAVPENGATAVHDCIGVVFEEHFQHLRYATRDLDRLG